MSANLNIREQELRAILQGHYRRFISSLEFIPVENGETVIEIIFENGDRERISKGLNNENNSGSIRRFAAAMAHS